MRYIYKIILIITGIANSYSCYAQEFRNLDYNSTCNTYIAGDKLLSRIIAYPTFEYKQGDNQLWDMSNVDGDKKKIATTYYIPKDSTLNTYTARLQNSTSSYYKVINSKILYFGLDNHTTTLRYNIPETIQYSKVAFGQHLEGHFMGNGVYAEKDSFQIWGEYHTEVKATGTLLTPDGETWENVLLQHTKRNLTIQENSNDTICLDIIENKWFVPNFRYPIVVNKEIKNKAGNSILEETLYTPYLQEYQSSLKNPMLQGSNKDNYKEGKITYNIANKDLQINQNEGILEINFYNNKNQMISYGIYSNEGIVIYHQNKELTKKGFTSKIIKAKLRKNRIYLITIAKEEDKQTYKYIAK